MPVFETFADTRTVQGRVADSTVSVTIPAPIADELDLGPGDEVLWTCDEGADEARIKKRQI